jgi:hypothetical protein
LVKTAPAEFRQSGGSKKQFYEGYFLKAANATRDSVMLVIPISTELYDKIQLSIDNLDDEIEQAIDEVQLSQILAVFLAEVINEIKIEQSKVIHIQRQENSIFNRLVLWIKTKF